MRLANPFTIMFTLRGFYRQAFRASSSTDIDTTADIVLSDTTKNDNSSRATLKASLTVFLQKLVSLITLSTSSIKGITVVKRASFAETADGVTHTATIPIPAGAIVSSIKVLNRALWGAGSAALDVGDTADPNGFFSAVDLKATDLLVGEVLETNNDALWGGKEGAYLVAATGRRGPTASNFAMAYTAGSNILGVITVGTPGATTGRTELVVEYTIPEEVEPVVATS